MAIKVKNVEANSFAKKIGLTENDLILRINDIFVEDFIDLSYFGAETGLKLDVMRDGKEMVMSGEKSSEETFGIVIEDHHCRECVNNCIFCFIDQMPRGMRETLYVKDDDYAYSLIYGNYITLTNLGPQMLEKIILMKISPLYISVHTTNSELRQKMMRYKQDFEVVDVLKRLADNGIEYHTQLVLVPGFNDGEELEKSLQELTSSKLNTIGIGVVPVGLTKYREGLMQLPLFTKEGAVEVIEIINKQRENFPNIYASDEFFIKAEMPIPDAEYYGCFDEIENGIGMVRSLLDNWEFEKESFAEFILTEIKQNLLFVTGVSAKDYIQQIADELNSLIAPYHAEVRVIINNFMGESVTVCGLLTFEDILKQIELKDGEVPVFSKDIFNSQGLTLDNFNSDYIKKEIKRDLIIVSPMFEEWELVRRK